MLLFARQRLSYWCNKITGVTRTTSRRSVHICYASYSTTHIWHDNLLEALMWRASAVVTNEQKKNNHIVTWWFFFDLNTHRCCFNLINYEYDLYLDMDVMLLCRHSKHIRCIIGVCGLFSKCVWSKPLEVGFLSFYGKFWLI